jgi:hypothetical protein
MMNLKSFNEEGVGVQGNGPIASLPGRSKGEVQNSISSDGRVPSAASAACQGLKASQTLARVNCHMHDQG